MKHEKITTDDIADALLHLSEDIGFCDEDTVTGFRTSKKKEILRSQKENSFAELTKEIRKRQTKKDWENINYDD